VDYLLKLASDTDFLSRVPYLENQLQVTSTDPQVDNDLVLHTRL
jgi:hypothetical protein